MLVVYKKANYEQVLVTSEEEEDRCFKYFGGSREDMIKNKQFKRFLIAGGIELSMKDLVADKVFGEVYDKS